MPPVLIADADHALTRAFADACAIRGLAWRRLEHGDSFDDPASFATVLDAHGPWAVVLTGFDGWSESGAVSLAAACAVGDVDLLVVTTGSRSEANGQAPRAVPAAVAAHPATLVVHLGGRAGSRLSPSTGGVVNAGVATAPLPAPDLVHACLDLLIDRERGWWNTAEPITSGGRRPMAETHHLPRSA